MIHPMELTSTENWPRSLSLKSDKITVNMADEKREYVLKKEKWENRKYVLDATTKELEEDIVGTFTQYPIKLSLGHYSA